MSLEEMHRFPDFVLGGSPPGEARGAPKREGEILCFFREPKYPLMPLISVIACDQTGASGGGRGLRTVPLAAWATVEFAVPIGRQRLDRRATRLSELGEHFSSRGRCCQRSARVGHMGILLKRVRYVLENPSLPQGLKAAHDDERDRNHERADQ